MTKISRPPQDHQELTIMNEVNRFATTNNPFLVQAEIPQERHFSGDAHRVKVLPLALFDRQDLPSETSDSELSGVTLEIAISWGTTVLNVAHLSPPRSFFVGEIGDSDPRLSEVVDFVVPEQALGRRRLPLVLVDGTDVQIVLPDIAVGTLKKKEQSFDIAELSGGAITCPTVTRARQLSLEPGARVHMKVGELEFHVSLVKRIRPMKRGLASGFDTTAASYFLTTLVMAGSLFGSLAYFVPPIGLDDDEGLDKNRLVLISQYLDAASEREQEVEETHSADDQGAEESGATGQRAQEKEGETGKLDVERTGKRVSVQGPRDNTQLQLSRAEAIALAQDFGMVGLLSSSQSSDPNAPTSVFGRDVTLGSDDLSASGNFFGDEPGESGGFGGLGVSGTGFGGGDLLGNGFGIGVGRIGTIGPGHGKEGYGRGQALTSKGHKVRDISVQPGKTQVNGRLPPQVIQRVVRQNFGRFRMCYSQALGRNPNLEGRIPVRFVIGRDGAVSNVSAGGDMPDASVRSCVQSAFYGISFPPPEGGIVTVTYPIMFSPG